MNTKSNYLISKFKATFPWTRYLIIKPVLVDENGNKAWFQEDINPNANYAKKMFIGINQLDRENGCAWLHLNNAINGKEQNLMFDYDWKDFKTVAIPFEDLHNNKHDALVDAIFVQLSILVGNGNNITTYRGIIFERE